MSRTENVARIRRLLEESVRERAANDVEAAARRQFDAYEFNTSLPSVDQTPRGRETRLIARIVGWYAWGGPEVARFLDRAHAPSVDLLPDDDLEDLAARLRQLEDCAQEGLDSPDAPAAR